MKQPSIKWAVRHIPDKFNSADDVLQIIDASKASKSHPQGPTVLATLNCRAFAPHIEVLVQVAILMKAAPQLLNASTVVLDSYETAGCCECGTISQEAHDILRKAHFQAVDVTSVK